MFTERLRRIFPWLFPQPAPPKAPEPPPVPLPTFETIAFGSDPKQTMDAYRPPNTFATDTPDTIVMVHGGGFVDGDKANDNVWVNKKAHYVDQQRKVLVCVNYRLNVPPNEQAKDVAAAVKALSGNGRIILMGHSAGGTDVALALSACASDLVVLLDPATLDAVDTMERPNPDPVFAPLGKDQAEWESNSPIAQLSGPIPPMLIVTSNERGKAFAKQAQAYADMAMHLGCQSATVQAYPDLSHEDCNALVGTDCPLTDAIDKFIG